ncbi:MAG: hypothetical protein LBE76_04090 [Nitrososphaerota archaeon]|jgi:hypothetical protein|nr:hypothetical protein [Nitrososphaerota archaeon]
MSVQIIHNKTRLLCLWIKLGYYSELDVKITAILSDDIFAYRDAIL